MHKYLIAAITLGFLLNPINAWVIPPKTPNLLRKRDGPAAELAAMLSNPNPCTSQFPECVTAANAVGPILDGLNRYKIFTAAEQAAVVSLMAMESVDFRFNHNVSPGVPGQGTRAMLSPGFVKEYINSMPEMAATASATNGDPVKLLALVQDNEHSFAAASWFYSTKCSADVKKQVQTGTQAGFSAYISSCVGSDGNDPTRLAYWARAAKQLGVGGS